MGLHPRQRSRCGSGPKNVLVTGDIGGARMGENLPIPSELERRRCGQRQVRFARCSPGPGCAGLRLRACP